MAAPSALLPPTKSEAKLPALKVAENVVALWYISGRVSGLAAELPQSPLKDATLFLKDDQILSSLKPMPVLTQTTRAFSKNDVFALELDPALALKAVVSSELILGWLRDRS